MAPVDYDKTPPATADDSAFVFYDIESLQNIFTVVAYRTVDAGVQVFYLIDEEPSKGLTREAVRQAFAPDDTNDFGIDRLGKANPALLARIAENPVVAEQLRADPTARPVLEFHDLAERSAVQALADTLGGVLFNGRTSVHEDAVCSINSRPIVCDTTPGYDPSEHPFITGYNSSHYDTTMLAAFFAERVDRNGRYVEVSAAKMREHNDELFTDENREYMPKYLYAYERANAVRRHWISSGRHVDIARLNELQQRVALKRLLGQAGHQILESDRLSGPNARVDSLDDVVDLLAYNVSDAVGTELLFRDSTYSGSFDLRSGLLRTYPETVFEHAGDYRTPVLDTARVQRGRLTIDTSSAKFAGRILAPYRSLREVPGHVADLPVVSYRYPHPSKCAPGTEPVNVLTETRNFFYQNVSDTSAREAFNHVYRYYRAIEGLNFSDANAGDYGPAASVTALRGLLGDHSAQSQPKDPACIDRIIEMKRVYEVLLPAKSQEWTIPVAPFFALLREINWWIESPYGPTGDGKDEAVAAVKRLNLLVVALLDKQVPCDPADDPADLSEIVVDLSGNSAVNSVHHLGEIAKLPNNIPYVTADGEPTSCFATFSTGGIHGAEVNQKLYDVDRSAVETAWSRFRAVVDASAAGFEDLRSALERDPSIGQTRLAPRRPMIDDVVAKGLVWADKAEQDQTLVPHGVLDARGEAYEPRTLALAAWFLRQRGSVTIIEPSTGEEVDVSHDEVLTADSKMDRPVLRAHPKSMRRVRLFAEKSASELPTVTHEGHPRAHAETKLDPRYVFTSVGDVIHEDFTSYYPLMLTNMAAFVNPDLEDEDGNARDRYGEIFENKERYGREMKDPSLSSEQRARLKILREGTKLILNAASGAADARHDTPILMNNRIITMRIIGQLFSWRIGQAQTLAGAKIVSTNTDGLYSTLDNETNQRVLDEHTDAIGVQIEPEELTLVSKDSNNRVEFAPAEPGKDPWDRVVFSASGASLACWTGPTPRKALNHSAISDRLLVEYFKRIVGQYVPKGSHEPCSIHRPADRGVLREILAQLRAELDEVSLLRLFQNLIAASPGKNVYLYTAPHRDPVVDATDSSWLTFPGDTREVTDEESLLEQPEASLYNRRPEAAEPSLLGHYSRVFSVDPAKVNVELLGRPVVIGSARARVVSSTVRESRIARKVTPVAQPDKVAVHLLRQAGADPETLKGRDLILGRHTGVDPLVPRIVFNQTLEHCGDPAVLRALIDALDIETYLDEAAESYASSWYTPLPESV